MSFPDSINNKRALFFLNNIASLISTGYPVPAIEDLEKPTESYIEVFNKYAEKGLSDEKTSQTRRIILQLLPEFFGHNLKRVFLAAIHAAPASSEENTQQILTCLQENQGSNLNQIYRNRFWVWMQNEAQNLPSDSVLFLLNIWKNFGNANINETAWYRVLSLSNWKLSQKQELEDIKLKHDFIVKHYQSFQHIKLKERESASDGTKVSIPKKPIKDVCKEYLDQYVLWAKALNVLLFRIAETYGMRPLGFKPNSWEYQLLYTPRKISPKILIWRANRVFPLYQKKIELLAKFLEEKCISLKTAQEREQRNQKDLRFALEQDVPVFSSTSRTSEAIRAVPLSDIEKEKDIGKPIPKEQLQSWLYKSIENEETLKRQLNEVKEFEQDVRNIECLRKQLTYSFSEKPEQEISQDRIALIEENQRKIIEEENQWIFAKEQVTRFFFEEKESSDNEIEECSEPSTNAQLSSASAPLLSISPFIEVDFFLENLGQINGALSKSIDGILKQLKTHLLKQTDLYDRKSLQEEKVHEVHAQLILATAAFEQVIQAIQDQKWDHVVLGFRSMFIHCHFAVEQMLSWKILLESNENTTTHNLVQLAEKAKLKEAQKWKEFLEDIAMHLWFCYPEDYRSSKKPHPKPFIFLEKLFYPFTGTKKKLDIQVIKEAIDLCFVKYHQTIRFIAEISLIDTKNINGFLEKVERVQKQIQSRIKVGYKKPHFENNVTILKKCNQALDVFQQMDALDNLQHFEVRAPLNTIKKYLQLMKISLQALQEPSTHSLQKFLQIETLANMDKLFKHLFRTIILLQTGKDNHSHNLSTLLQAVESFYAADPLKEDDKRVIKEINLSIAHHYLYKESHALLKKNYNDIFDLSCKLVTVEKNFSIMHKGRNISYKTLEAKIKEARKNLENALELFAKLLQPVLSELKQLNDIS